MFRSVWDRIHSVSVPHRIIFISGPIRQRLNRTKSVWNRYKISTDKPCVYTGPGESGTDQTRYLVSNGSTYEVIPCETVPFQFRTGPV